jgi:cytochrome c
VTALVRTWLVVGVLTGCSAALPAPNAAHVARLRPSDPAVNLHDLERGRTLYVERCSACHTLKEPQRYSTDEWVASMRKMEVEEGVVLEPTEARDIERYLVAMSSPVTPGARQSSTRSSTSPGTGR